MYLNFEKKMEIDIESLKSPIVLIGWPGIALVSKLAISSIKDSIDAKLFLDIDCFDFPPKSKVENGSLEIPTAQVFYKTSDSANLENDFFILTADYQPQTPEGVFEFSKLFCEEMDKLTGGKIKMYVSAGALVTDKVNEIPQVHICGTHQDLVETFLKQENTKLMDSGVIAGANGILPAWAGSKGHAPGICLLAETLPLPMMSLDPRASKALVELIKNYFSIDMDFSEIDKKIEEMETIFDSFRKQAEHYMKDDREELGGSDSYFR